MTRIRRLILPLLFALPCLAAAAPVLEIKGGKLMGADGVHIGTRLYNVRFVEGSCAEVFGTCTDNAFTFHTRLQAEAASIALLDTVLLDGRLGNFDSDPTLTFGIGPVCGIQCGNVLTPYLDLGTHVSVSSAFNRPAGGTNMLTGGDVFKPNTSNGDPNSVWAVWTERSRGLPEPSSLALALGGALCAITSASRRRKA